MIYLELFIRFFTIGICSFGGGYAAMPLIKSHIVESAGWMTESQFIDLISISEMTPGPIILNTATFTGEQMAGMGGAFAATLGSILPSVIIVSVISRVYFKSKNTEKIQQALYFARPAVCALIFSAGLSLLISAFLTESWIMIGTQIPLDIWAVIMTLVCFVLLRKFKRSPMLIILVSALSGLLVYAVIPQISGI